jgi:hypothetical protein
MGSIGEYEEAKCNSYNSHLFQDYNRLADPGIQLI